MFALFHRKNLRLNRKNIVSTKILVFSYHIWCRRWQLFKERNFIHVLLNWVIGKYLEKFYSVVEGIKIIFCFSQNVYPEITHIIPIYSRLYAVFHDTFHINFSSPAIKRNISGHTFQDEKCQFRFPLPPFKIFPVIIRSPVQNTDFIYCFFA